MKEIKQLVSLLDRSAKWTLLVLTVLVCLTGPAEVLGLGAIVAFLGVVANPETASSNKYLVAFSEFVGTEQLGDFVTILGLSMILIVSLSNLLLALVNYFTLQLTWDQHKKISTRLVGSYLQRDYLWFLGKNTTELSKSVLSEVQEVINGVLKPGIGLISSAFRVVSLGVFLFAINPGVALVASLLGGGGFSLLTWLTHSRQAHLGTVRLNALRSMYKMSSEMFSGIKEVKLSGAMGYLLNRFEQEVQAFGTTQVTSNTMREVPKYLSQTVALSGVVILAVFLFRSGYRDQQVFTTLALFAMGGYRLMGALQRAFANYSQIRFGSPALKALHDELHSANPPKPTGSHISFLTQIQVTGLGFCYPEQECPVLSDVDLTILRHSKIAFVGTTGSGKTTLVNLLTGLLQPSTGSIQIDGKLLENGQISAWYKKIGYVPQDVFLLDDTVLRNIAFAVPDEKIDLEAAKKAARIAQIHGFIENEMSSGYSSIIGERGARLSGGQRQRIGIARALYHDPDVLILDEATSALDGETEQAVVEGVETSSNTKTVIVIAHRIQTVQRCDVIHVLREGRIISSGSYEELLARCPDFQALTGSMNNQQA